MRHSSLLPIFLVIAAGCGGGSSYTQKPDGAAGATSILVQGGGAGTTVPGGTATFQIDARLVRNANLRDANDVTLGVTGLPEGIASSFSVNPLRATEEGGRSTLSVAVPNSLAAGDYPFSIVATARGRDQVLGATLTVQSLAFDYTVLGNAWIRADLGEEITYHGSVRTLEGDPGEALVDLSVTGFPAGTEWEIDPESVTPTESGQDFSIRISTPSDAAPGRYPFTVKGKYGQVARTREAALFLYAPDN